MHLRLLILLVLPAFFSTAVRAQEEAESRIVQINGITITADSLLLIPGVTVVVKDKYRGVISSDQGVFSIVCYKGDTLEFSAVGFRPKLYVVPKGIQGQYFSMVQQMVQDTFYLPETVVRPLPGKDEFGYAFRNWHIPGDQYELARQNTDPGTMNTLMYSLGRDGRESQALYQAQLAKDAMYYGSYKPYQIFNPLAWAEFFDAWKRGDFKKK
jgi:hypothetical protein